MALRAEERRDKLRKAAVPLTFLKNKALWPLSLYLPEIGLNQAGFAFAASVVTLIPALFIFLLGQDYLEQGIAMSGLKE